MTETASTRQKELTPFGGFDLAIGSVLGVRWFAVDGEGRLRGRSYPLIWKPGENVAQCRRADHDSWGFVNPMQYLRLAFTAVPVTYSVSLPIGSSSLADEAVEARVEVKCQPPGDMCGCGFYAFAEGCDDGTYANDNAVMGVVECYGRVILGTKGMRAEKARVVALTGAGKTTRELYPDVKHFRKSRWMLRRFDITQPARRTPDTDPNFWGER